MAQKIPELDSARSRRGSVEWNEGWQAYMSGKNMSANPYNPENPREYENYLSWNSGYTKAMEKSE